MFSRKWIVLALLSVVLSFVIHAPIHQNTLLRYIGYSDIIGIFNTRVLPRVVVTFHKVNETTYTVSFQNVSGKYCGIPYRDYFFEYPPLSAGIWYVSSCGAYLLVSSIWGGEQYFIVLVFYTLISCFLAFFYFISIYFLYRIFNIYKFLDRRLLLFILSPSVIMYLIYNFDIVALAFMLMGIYYYLKREYMKSGLSLGLGVSAKILPIGIAYIIFLKLIAEHKVNCLKKFVSGLVATISIPYMIQLLIAPKSFIDVYNHLSNWYCENCIYMYIVNNIHSIMNKVAFIATASLIVACLTLHLLKHRNGNIILYSFVMIHALTVFNYINPPQFFIYILPFALLLSTSHHVLAGYFIADFLNAFFIIAFMLDHLFRAFIGKPPIYDPFSPGSFPQILFLERNALLIILLLYILYEHFFKNKRLKIARTGSETERHTNNTQLCFKA